MSKSVGRFDIALGGLGAALILVVIALGALTYSQQENQQRYEREQSAQHQANDGEQQWEAVCAPVARNRPFSCVLHPPNADAETQRAERDLRAQEQMANWALLMFITSVVGALTTIIGLIYIVKAYLANVEATEAATLAANAATSTLHSGRAWIMPSGRVEVDPLGPGFTFRDKPMNGGQRVALLLTNFGQSPAMNVSSAAEQILIDTVGESSLAYMVFPDEGTRDSAAPPGASAGGIAVFLSADDVAKIRRGERTPYVYTRITYRDIFQPELVRETQLCFRLELHGQKMMIKDGAMIDQWTFVAQPRFTHMT